MPRGRRPFGARLAIELLELRTMLSATTYNGGTYTQDFDNLFSTVPKDDSTASATVLPAGWGFLESGSNANTSLRVDNGSSTTGDTFLYGSTGSNERAFGSFATGSLTSNYGLQLVNNTGQTITSFTLKYTGEQWKDGSSASAVQNTLQFSWATTATTFNSGTYNSVAALNFVAPQTAGNGVSGSGDITLDGNAAANQVAVGGDSGVTVTVNWQPGATLWLRWSDINDPGNDDGMAIDNVVFSTTASTDTSPVIVSSSATVAEGAQNVAIGTAQLQSTDLEQGAASLTYTLTAVPVHGTLSKSGATLAIGGTFTQADVDAGLITYSHDGSETSSDAFSFTVSDGAGGATSGTFAITVTPVNDPPVNSVPGSQTVVQGAAFVFSSAYGNAVQISDADAGSQPVQVTLAVGHGTLSLAGTTGLTFVSGGSGSSSITFTGQISDINAALAGLTYVPTANYLGSDSLSITTNDLGHSGAGGAQSDADTIAMTVIAPPVAILNEIKANPPGHETGGDEYQFVELKGSPGASLNNVYFVEFDGNSSDNRGDAEFVVNLSNATIGSNGYLVIKSPSGGNTVASGATVVTDPQFDVPGGALDKHTVSFYLFYSPTPFVEGTDYDTNDDGTLDHLPSGSVVLDNVGWSDGDSGDKVYGGVALSQSQGTPDAATRIPGTVVSNAAAWYNADLYDVGNLPSQLLYDATRTSANMPLTPAVPYMTPGSANFSEPSQLTTTGAALMFTEGETAIPLDSNVTVSDIDSPLLSSASVQIANNYVQGQEVLSFTNTPNLVGAFDAATGTLTITGNDTPAAYQNALRSVLYQNLSDNPSTAERTVAFTVTDGFATSNTSTRPLDVIAVDTPPKVMGVYVSGGNNWDSSYYDYLDSNGYGNSTVTGLGYNVSNGAHQLDTLPWLDLNTLNILFSENVNITESSLQLIGPDSPDAPSLPSISGFSYNSSTHVATWTFASQPVGNRILLHFDAASVTDTAGDMLDGYWQDGSSSSTTGSGNGGQGSDFNFMMYVLPGDQLNQQTVTLADAKQIVPSINLSAGDAGYNYRMDVLGQGTITLADAKQIVPHINDDISGLDDPNAPAPSNAISAEDDVEFTVTTGSDLVAPSVAPSVATSSFSDQAVAVDLLFAGDVDWLTPSPPPLSLTPNQTPSLAGLRVQATANPFAVPTAVVAPQSRIASVLITPETPTDAAAKLLAESGGDDEVGDNKQGRQSWRGSAGHESRR